jgi:hypothetical protein
LRPKLPGGIRNGEVNMTDRRYISATLVTF